VKSICNFRYARTKRGSSQFPNVRGLLKYIQYRDNRDDHIPGGGGPDRWVDGGLGDSYPAILARLDELSAGNPHAYCFTLVISPDPKAMAEVEGDPHARFVDAVRASMSVWEPWRHAVQHDRPLAGPIEYSFVVHRPERHYGEQMHAHLVLPAATENAMNGDLAPLYNNPRHVEALKEIVYRQLDRVFELEHEQKQPELRLEMEPQPRRVLHEREIPFHESHRPEEGA